MLVCQSVTKVGHRLDYELFAVDLLPADDDLIRWRHSPGDRRRKVRDALRRFEVGGR